MQNQVDSAPPFPVVMEEFQTFMVKHGLLDKESGERLVRFCWCSDGPFDVRDFVVKQCFISKVSEYIDFGIPCSFFRPLTTSTCALDTNAGLASR